MYVTENSAEKLGETILRALDDPALRATLGARGLERLQTKLNWERSVEQLLAGYDRALEQ